MLAFPYIYFLKFLNINISISILVLNILSYRDFLNFIFLQAVGMCMYECLCVPVCVLCVRLCVLMCVPVCAPVCTCVCTCVCTHMHLCSGEHLLCYYSSSSIETSMSIRVNVLIFLKRMALPFYYTAVNSLVASLLLSD